jgi:hypothetical protein
MTIVEHQDSSDGKWAGLAAFSIKLKSSERGVDISHETVRYRWNRFGPLFAGSAGSG